MIRKKAKKLIDRLKKPVLELPAIVSDIKNNWVDFAKIKKHLTNKLDPKVRPYC